MHIELLNEVIQDHSFFDPPKKTKFIARQVCLPKKLHQDIVLVIQGVRRCGKSTLLTQIPAFYQLNWKNCFFCNFEDPRLIGELNHELLTQIVKLARSKIASDETCYFLFDEIQNVALWEKWMHIQLERPNNNYFVVTSSNSALLSGEFGSVLTGRHLSLELTPFSLKEFLSCDPNFHLQDYLKIGGFPKAIFHDKPYWLLQEYFSDIILRDVVKRIKARHPQEVALVLKIAFDSTGSKLSYRKIAAAVGLSVETIQSYLYACEQAYLLLPCKFFCFSEKKKALTQKKYYPIDQGLRQAVVGNQARDLGKSLENTVYLGLRRKYQEVYYWDDQHGHEIDFVVIDNNKITPIQVTWDAPKERHQYALDQFYKAHVNALEPIFITQENVKDWI